MSECAQLALALWGELSGFGEIRIFGSGRIPQQIWIPLPIDPRELSSAIAQALLSNRSGAGVYLGVNPRVRRRGRSKDVGYRVAFVIDVDHDKLDSGRVAVRRLAAAGLPPSIIVHSGRGRHAYYLLTDLVPADDRSYAIAQRLCRFTHSDAVQDASRVLRMPGTENWKDRGNPHRCRLLLLRADRRYSLDRIDAVLDEVGEPRIEPRRARSSSTHSRSAGATLSLSSSTPPPLPETFRPDLLKHALQGSPVGQRSERDIALIRALMIHGWSDEQVVGLLHQHPEGCGSKYTECGDDYLDRTLCRARERVEADLADKVPAVITRTRWLGRTSEIQMVLRLDDGREARARISIKRRQRWNAFWRSIRCEPPTSVAEAIALTMFLPGCRVRVETVQRPHALAVSRFWPCPIATDEAETPAKEDV